MIDYSKFYNDPRPYTDRAMTRLTDAIAKNRTLNQRRDELQESIRQHDQGHELGLGRLAEWKKENERRADTNELNREKFTHQKTVDKQTQARYDDQNDRLNQAHNLQMMKNKYSFLGKLVNSVEDEKDWQSAVESIKGLAEANLISEEELKSIPAEFDKEWLDKTKKAMSALSDDKTWGKIMKKNGLIYQIEKKSGKAVLLGTDGKKTSDPIVTEQVKGIVKSISNIDDILTKGSEQDPETLEEMPITNGRRSELERQKVRFKNEIRMLEGKEPLEMPELIVTIGSGENSFDATESQYEKMKEIQRQKVAGEINEREAEEKIKALFLPETEAAEKKPEKEEPKEKPKPKKRTRDTTTTQRTRDYFNSEESKKRGIETIFSNPTEEEKKRRREARRGRIAGSFLRGAPY